MQYSYSRVDTFSRCPYKFKLRYIDKLEVLPNLDASDPLLIGTAVHEAIEKDINTALHDYYMSYPVITDAIELEATKIREVVKKVDVPQGQFEYEINTPDFKGFIDLLVHVDRHIFDIYDFKYSNNIDSYLESEQLHLYKYFYEMQTGGRVRNLYYVFIPKTMIRQKKTETEDDFKRRLLETLEKSEVQIVKVEFDYTKVVNFLLKIKHIQECEVFTKNETRLCNFCEYEDYCQKGRDYMLLPSSERVIKREVEKTKTWIYGQPFTGKTTMLDKAPKPLNINTDGNTQFVTMPRIKVEDEITTEGRITKHKYAWEIFKEIIRELEYKNNDFETIIIDLLEDTREMCRLYKYNEMGIQHESDSGYGKGWDIIKTEYLSTMRRFFNLPYKHLVVVSHELEGEIKKSNGTTITTCKPNIQDAIANKIAGMVDIVARVVKKSDGTRVLNFKSNEYIFGGGRLTNLTETEIPLSWDALMQVYNDALIKSTETVVESEVTDEETLTPPTKVEIETENTTESEVTEEKPRSRRTRKKRDEE